MQNNLEPNPYVPPASGDSPVSESPTDDPAEMDNLMAALQLTPLGKGAVGTMAALGALLFGSALQLWGLTSLLGVVRFVPYLMVTLGASFLLLAAKVYRGRPWAAILGAVLAGLTALGMALWFLLSAASGFISLLALLVPVLAVVAAVFSGIAIPAALRCAAARRRLAASGVPMDF